MIQKTSTKSIALARWFDCDVLDKVGICLRPRDHEADDLPLHFEYDAPTLGYRLHVVSEHRRGLASDAGDIFGVGGSGDRADLPGVARGRLADTNCVAHHRRRDLTVSHCGWGQLMPALALRTRCNSRRTLFSEGEAVRFNYRQRKKDR